MIKFDFQISLGGKGRVKNFHYKDQFPLGSLNVVYGPSGEGKTTLLRAICGLSVPGNGRIEFDGDVWFDSNDNVNISVADRKLGMVFQDHQLFPHMTVSQNLAFAKKSVKNLEISYLLEAFELNELLNEYPNQLSGGQIQRVAIAQALVQKPRLLLLDEPMSALDSATRLKTQMALRRIQKENNITVLMVSHDLQEALRLSDEVLLIQNGRNVEKGTPTQVLLKESLKGEILSITPNKEEFLVQVLVGNGIVEVKRKQSINPNLNVGDVIDIEVV